MLEEVLEHCGEAGKFLLQQHPTFVRNAINLGTSLCIPGNHRTALTTPTEGWSGSSEDW